MAKGGDKKQSNEWKLGGVAMIILCLAVMWLLFGATLVHGLAWLRSYELGVLAPVSSYAGELADALGTYSPTGRSIAEMMHMLRLTGAPLSYLAAPILFGFAIWMCVSSPIRRFRKSHTMKSLVEQEKALWPELSPVAGKDLVSGDITKGKWAAALTEYEFMRKHDLLDAEGAFREEAAAEVFTRQLGPLWEGSGKLPPHARALYAVFCLKLTGETTVAMQRLDELNVGYTEADGVSKCDLSWTDAAIKAGEGYFLVHKTSGEKYYLVQEVLRRHAYVFTVMATMLSASRSNGVLASAKFLWLKTVDRRLWYTLNGVGRHAHFVETAGIMSHRLAEKVVGTKLYAPYVKGAVDGLREAKDRFREEDVLEKYFKK